MTDVVRLKINLAPDVAEVLEELAADRGDSVTETVRRAIAALKFMTDVQHAGGNIATVSANGVVQPVRTDHRDR